MGTFDFLFKKARNQQKKNDINLFNLTDNVNSNEEIASEFSDAELYPISEQPEVHPGSYETVTLEKVPNTVKVTYKGELVHHNTLDIYAVIGYGNNLKWENTVTYKMQKKNDQSYELLFDVKQPGNINIAFKDTENHWDNNSGMNYVFENKYFNDVQ